MCGESLESIMQLLVFCDIARSLWSAVLQASNLSWCIPNDLQSLLSCWEGAYPSVVEIKDWRTIPISLFWCIWNQRNNRIFEDLSKPLHVLICHGALDDSFLCVTTFTQLKMFFDGYGYHGTSFEKTYRCYPASFIEKPQIESGDKIIMPPSALDRLASLHIDYPMLFELRNAAAERVSHCGVLEFIAEEGMIYMPYWMMENMLLQEGDTVRVKNATLPKGTYVKLQPHTKDFLDISNPKAILETTLRNFSCLTTGDSIMVAYNNKKYYIDIIETKPSNAISIIETDCEVDFAQPLDYKEPEKPVASVPTSKALAQVQKAPAETEPKFSPFTGSGRRLDGKPLKDQSSPVSSSGSKNKQPAAASGNGKPSAGSSSQSTTRQSQGKLVFGSNVHRTPKETQKEAAKETKQEQPQKKEEPKFQAFTGKKYSLKG